MINFKSIATAIALTSAATFAHADGHAQAWTLDSTLSKVSFGSIKNDYVGESHSFDDVTGTVSADGMVTIELGLPSLETLIDIRNERMLKYVFGGTKVATVTAELDMAELNDLAVGQARTIETYGTLNLIGLETDLDATFFVMRLNDDSVLVTTDGMVMLSTEDAGLDDGVNKLQELASLDSITRVSPVTMRLVFNKAG